MDGLCIAAIGAGVAGLLGGVLWGWGASRSAARVAVKIVTAAKDTGTDPQLRARVTALEIWKARTETGGASQEGSAE